MKKFKKYLNYIFVVMKEREFILNLLQKDIVYLYFENELNNNDSEDKEINEELELKRKKIIEINRRLKK